ncbi:MAG TPA: PDZ domain-containing protein [Actinomycetota bacterium]|nr:PDZ domain-containing protein [Actinomycetota bacterium]
MRDQRRSRRTLLMVSPLATLAICLFLVDLPLFIESPGSAKPVLSLIDIDGTETYDSRGRLLLTTVNVGRSNAFDALRAWIDDDAELVPERELIPPGQTDREYDEVQFSLMDQSKIAAVAVALRRLTDYPREHRDGVIVHAVEPGTPADGRLFPGDLISEVDGEPLSDLTDLRRRIEEARGSPLSFSVGPLEGGRSRTVSIEPVTSGDGPIIGISALANFPFDVGIESGNIGGPSAGLVYALGVADLLSPVDLTDGRVVAGTGTVGLDGTVGPIGAIDLKIVAAARAGADVFLLPRGNVPEARRAGDMELVPVATVAEALEVLEER